MSSPLQRIIEMCDDEGGGDTRSVVPGFLLTKETLPSDSSVYLTSTWWAAEQSQGSASIPEAMLWQPAIIGGHFDLYRIR